LEKEKARPKLRSVLDGAVSLTNLFMHKEAYIIGRKLAQKNKPLAEPICFA
jgi:hypothetical protein